MALLACRIGLTGVAVFGPGSGSFGWPFVVLVVLVILLSDRRFPEDEIWQQVGWVALALAVALPVFGWGGRTVRITATREGFAVTRRILRWFRFSTFRRYDEITAITEGPDPTNFSEASSSRLSNYRDCCIHVSGFLRSIRFGQGEPVEAQRRFVRELKEQMADHRSARDGA